MRSRFLENVLWMAATNRLFRFSLPSLTLPSEKNFAYHDAGEHDMAYHRTASGGERWRARQVIVEYGVGPRRGVAAPAPVPPSSLYDIDRNGRIDKLDVRAVRKNRTKPHDAMRLIMVPVRLPSASLAAVKTGDEQR